MPFIDLSSGDRFRIADCHYHGDVLWSFSGENVNQQGQTRRVHYLLKREAGSAALLRSLTTGAALSTVGGLIGSLAARAGVALGATIGAAVGWYWDKHLGAHADEGYYDLLTHSLDRDFKSVYHKDDVDP